VSGTKTETTEEICTENGWLAKPAVRSIAQFLPKASCGLAAPSITGRSIMQSEKLTAKLRHELVGYAVNVVYLRSVRRALVASRVTRGR